MVKTTLNNDIKYQGGVDSTVDPFLNTMPLPMAQKSMYGIYFDLMAAVDDQWAFNPKNNAYMDSYLFNMKMDKSNKETYGTNPELDMTSDHGWNWLQECSASQQQRNRHKSSQHEPFCINT